jgi:hypothetical protein
MNSLPFQKLLSSLFRLFTSLVNMVGVSRSVYILDRNAAETQRYVFSCRTMSHLQCMKYIPDILCLQDSPVTNLGTLTGVPTR